MSKKYIISPLSLDSSDRPLQYPERRIGENRGVCEAFVAGNGEERVNEPDGIAGVAGQVG